MHCSLCVAVNGEQSKSPNATKHPNKNLAAFAVRYANSEQILNDSIRQ